MKQTLIDALNATLSERMRQRVFNLGFNLSPAQFRLFAYRYAHAPMMDHGLRHLAERGFRPAAIVDIGGYDGDWSRTARAIWPEARITICEANEVKRAGLERVASEIGADLHMALLGPDDDTEHVFHVMESGSSVYEENSPLPRARVVLRTRRLDTLLDGARADFLKLDVQGFELQVLRGATAALKSAQAVLLEVSLLRINAGAPLFAEVVAFMAERGFEVCDILEVHRRPLDQATNQVDVLFVPKDSPLLADTRHFA